MDVWMVLLLLFMFASEDSETMKLLTSSDFESDFNNSMNLLKSKDAEELKQSLISNFEKCKNNLEMINNAYKQTEK